MSITSIAFKSKGTLLEGVISTPYDKSDRTQLSLLATPIPHLGAIWVKR